MKLCWDWMHQGRFQRARTERLHPRAGGRSLKWGPLLAAGLTLATGFALATEASAAPKDDDARALNDEAIMTDYLTLNLDAAVSKLQKAINLCGSSDCSPQVLGKLHRDLGVVYVAGMQKREEGLAAFVAALRADPEVELDKDLSTPEVEAVFAEAKGQSGEAPKEDEPKPSAPPPQSDDIEHTPPSEQATLTPVPIFVKLPEGSDVGKVRVRYMPFGASTWKNVSLDERQDGYGGYIPCLDVGSATGDLRYFIEVLDDDDAVVAAAGSESDPFRVPIKNTLSGDAPHLPGKPAPAQCQDAADCPPEFPGCGGGVEEEEEEEEDLGDEILNWFFFGGQFDMMLMPSTNGACLSTAPANYECYYGDGQQRVVGNPAPSPNSDFAEPGIVDPSTGELAGAGNVGGGLAPATIRALLGFDRVFLHNFTGGIRLGFAFNGGPTSDPATGSKGFKPVHAELGVAYWIGKSPFARKGFRPFLRVAGGMAQFDAKLTSAILDMRQSTLDRTLPPAPASNATPAVEVWKRAGGFFASVGLGTMFAIKPNHGPLLELKGMMMFPDSAMGVAAKLGYGVGF